MSACEGCGHDPEALFDAPRERLDPAWLGPDDCVLAEMDMRSGRPEKVLTPKVLCVPGWGLDAKAGSERYRGRPDVGVFRLVRVREDLR